LGQTNSGVSPGRGDFCAIFWGVGLGDFAGVFEEMWCLHVVFCGQYVVESAVSLVSGPVLFRGWKFGTFFWNYF
jgi:hypothetical protein